MEKVRVQLSQNSISKRQACMSDRSEVLREKILQSFAYRPEQSLNNIHEYVRGDIDSLGEMLKQLQVNGEITCFQRNPLRYRRSTHGL